jgi:acetyl-CoA carboxylase biotin carboxylase subunit
LKLPFNKVLVANRGEIAVRVMRSLRELGLGAVAVYSEADRDALHVRYADEAYCVGPAPSAESYLVIERLIDVCRRSGAGAVHPGYGFLSERAPFAKAVIDAGLVWIGPPPAAIDSMGDKITARRLMSEAGVPVVPGTPEAIEDPHAALAIAREIGFPVLIKASAGGGGKGMRRVNAEADFVSAFEGASREAAAAFGRGDCYIEKLLLNPKHVEVQILFDRHGNGVHLFERDCSVQRRHQKVIEESPCPVLRPETREAMGAVALQAARAVDYESAGTIEFLLDSDQSFYFLEMNTRLQVEHPVTEAITGKDLVALQVLCAGDIPLPFRQADLAVHGAAIEARIYAENPGNNFLPAPGPVERLRWPEGPGIRVDSGVYEGCEVSMFYDPMLAKLTVWAGDRDAAIARMRRALSELVIEGLETNVDFLDRVLTHEAFRAGTYDIGMVERDRDALLVPRDEAEALAEVARLAAVAAMRQRDERAAGGAGAGAGVSTGGAGAAASSNGWRRHGLLRQVGSGDWTVRR